MQFDFKIFDKIAAKAYKEVIHPFYSFDEVIRIFHYYFKKYELCTGRPHPPIKQEQIFRIIEEMPCTPIMKGERGFAEIDAETYKDIIDLHFKTKYRRCDYGISHFFSGRIRELRLHEIGEL